MEPSAARLGMGDQVSVASPAAEKHVLPAKKTKNPPVSDMVVNAVKTLKKGRGSSLKTIKKFLAAQYKVDVEKLAAVIKKFLKSAVAKGQLLQTGGLGASGYFKLATAAQKEEVKRAAAKKRAAKQNRQEDHCCL